ncbi:MAG: YidC/Oxa1 family membrane protein insertase [Lachnospiraceae bacterium]|nr:YidC/Oxa1 family membrane protein insertase [Lachnospiraceae bacterium]
MSLLTKSGGFLGPIATVLGYVMSGIFALLVAINIPNIGLAIILFTIVIYMIMLPLTYRQQKFSRMTPLMNPELNAIRDKYKGKQDQASMQRMNEETQMVYAKYGVNPAGSCVQLAIQMLILFPLYRVIMNIPAYVSQVKDVFTGLADQLLKTAGAQEYLTDIAKSIQAMTISKEFTQNTIIDTLYKFRPATWAGLAEKFPDLSDLITTTQQNIGKMNNFLGLDIANTPMNIIKEHASVWLVIAAVLVPVLAALSQWISVRLSMAGTQQPEGTDQMASTMKTMNNVMPLMSAFFCLTLPVGMGIYWIMSAVVRTVQQYFINKRLDKQDMTELLKKNMEKNKKKMEKKGGVTGAQISQNASINAKNIENQNQAQVRSSNRLERAKQLSKEAANVSDDAAQKSRNNLRPGSLAEKANMVSQYNETHRKK